VAGVIAAACGGAVFTGPPDPGDAAGHVHVGSGKGTGPVGRTATSAERPADWHGPSVPTDVRGPHGFRARIVPVAAGRDGALNLPEDARSGAWWALGAPVGAARGTVLVAGHVDTRREGLGVFAALHALRPGTEIEVTGANRHTYRYVISARRTYPRQALPRDLFSRAGPHRLALVTCTGTYDRTTGGYDRNLVLYATSAPGHGVPR
jgi:hypothetical protein